MSNQVILQIAVPTPLRCLFDYLPPHNASSATLQTGMRIQVPLGNRKVIGILINKISHSKIDNSKLKTALQILDDKPLLPSTLIELISWASDYYQHPIGDCWHNAIPNSLRKGDNLELRTQKMLRLTVKGKGLPVGALQRAGKQKILLERLQQNGQLSGKQAQEEGISRPVIKALLDKQLIEEVTIEDQHAVLAHFATNQKGSETALSLNQQQQYAKESISKQLNQFNVFLLEGVTGSGKTEVYLQIIAEVLDRKCQALVLVPEIGLTPQTVDRFKRRFSCTIGVLHSGLNDRERLDAWLLSQRGQAGIIIGTRSAIFTPMANPGIIIVDEEHDLSFKQQDGFRYSARDIAVMRGQFEQIPVVLGSATPSLESINNAEYKRYQHLRLTERAGQAKDPEFNLLDIRHKPLTEGFSKPLLDAIEQTLKSQQQALVFINRRGFAPVLMCHDCGWIAECPACDIRMTVHREPPRLHCHHCELIKPLPNHCPNCQSQPLQQLGLGTERSEIALTQLFPTTPIYRIDRDTTQRKFAMENMVNDINQGGAAILVGTQMLAKGHHFPHVTLVAILDADAGLFGVDFRAPERMGQLLIQVAGRAGRAENPGSVYIQTHFPEHPLINTLITRGYPTFAHNLLAERQRLGLPPRSYMALLRSDHNDPDRVTRFLSEVRHTAERQALPLHLVGPLPAAIAKRAHRYRYQLLIISPQRRQLQQAIRSLIQSIETMASARSLRWSIDIDPQDMN